MDWLKTSVRPPYELTNNPLIGIAATLALGFIGVLFIRVAVEHDLYFLRWTTFRYGDSIALGLIYAFFAVRALRGFNPDGHLYTERWVYLAFTLVGLLIGVALLAGAKSSRNLTWGEVFNPSELWHTLITWPALMAMVGGSFIPVWASDAPLSDKLGATVGVLMFAALVYYDTFINPDRAKPGR